MKKSEYRSLGAFILAFAFFLSGFSFYASADSVEFDAVETDDEPEWASGMDDWLARILAIGVDDLGYKYWVNEVRVLSDDHWVIDSRPCNIDIETYFQILPHDPDDKPLLCYFLFNGISCDEYHDGVHEEKHQKEYERRIAEIPVTYEDYSQIEQKEREIKYAFMKETYEIFNSKVLKALGLDPDKTTFAEYKDDASEYLCHTYLTKAQMIELAETHPAFIRYMCRVRRDPNDPDVPYFTDVDYNQIYLPKIESLNSAVALLVLRLSAGHWTRTFGDKGEDIMYDFNLDNKVDSADALFALRASVGLETEYPEHDEMLNLYFCDHIVL